LELDFVVSQITSIGALISFVLYYGIALLGSFNFMAVLFQIELNGVYFKILTNLKTLFLVVGLPLFLLLPDFTIK
jgi:hypothetical protein